MSRLQSFMKILLDDKGKILKGKSPYQDIVKELTSSKEYKDELLEISTITIKLIDKDINLEDFKVAISMIGGIVDTMLMHLMEKNDLRFMKKIMS